MSRGGGGGRGEGGESRLEELFSIQFNSLTLFMHVKFIR